MNKKLFALDIGTRSVVGIILEEENNKFHVVDILAIEHSERAMLDGQIHDVLSVSKIIKQIKQQLENKHGPLKKVCVAAAGRALKTERALAEVTIKNKPMMKSSDIFHLELSAVQQAQATVAEQNEETNSHYYYCVGYSVLYYRLDGEEIGNLIDQQGDVASVEIIATFLPKVVVESLISALSRAELEMEALTLEPIAAINVLIPPSMRRLNVALVDIGAGTSDIALTDKGTVIAYGMVPIAGDEITEAISDQYLLDFPLAEKAKRELYDNNKITITDILGFETLVEKDEVIAQVSPALDRLASSICDEILRLNNHKPPKAVMLVGGGSLTPELPKRISEKLNLPLNRVAIRGIDAISSLTISEKITKGPELVTPIGIAIAAKTTPVQYATIIVNDQPVRLFEVNILTVGDCLLAAGIKMNKLYGKPGMAMIVELNGQNITIPGQFGEPPKIMKNGIACSLDDEVQSGDHLTVEKGKDGGKTFLQIKELIDEIPAKLVTINEKRYAVSAKLTCNGLEVPPDKLIEDRDKIECKIPETLEDLFLSLNLEKFLTQLKPFRLRINEKETFIPPFSGKLLRNGLEVRPTSNFENEDMIEVIKKGKPTIGELANIKQINISHSIPIHFNGTKLTITQTISKFYRQDIPLTEEDIVMHGDHILITQNPIQPFIFQDIFKHIEIQMPPQSNGKFILLKNGENTTFNDIIQPGDHLEINWPENEKVEAGGFASKHTVLINKETP